MSWVRSKAVEVYLGETLVGCKGLDDAAERWAEVADVQAGLAQLREWASAAGVPVRARVWLGSALARPLVLAGDCGAKNLEEIKALAAMTASDITGLPGELKVWTAPWRANRPTLAVAISRTLLAALETATSSSAEKLLRVDSVRPWWNQVFDAVLDSSRAQACSIGWTLMEPDGLVHGRVARGEAIESAFEGSKARDPDWSLLRRRLAIGWDGVDEIEHFGFEAGAAVSGKASLFAIARASLLGEKEAAA